MLLRVPSRGKRTESTAALGSRAASQPRALAGPESALMSARRGVHRAITGRTPESEFPVSGRA